MPLSGKLTRSQISRLRALKACVVLAALCGAQLNAEQRPVAPAQDAGPELKKLLATVKTLGGKSAQPELVRALRPGLGAHFTIAFASESLQGPERALLFGDSAASVLALPSGDGDFEFVEDRDGIFVPYTIEVRKSGTGRSYHPKTSPKSCKNCHGEPFTLIWGEYKNDAFHKTWRGFLGESDDRVEPESPVFLAMKSRPNFAPLFEAKGLRASYPYWQTLAPTEEEGKPVKGTDIKGNGGLFRGGELPVVPGAKFNSFRERDFWKNTPNAFLTSLLAARASRSVALRAQKLHPERYEKYRFALLYRGLNCRKLESGGQGGSYEESQEFEGVLRTSLTSDFRKLAPKRFEKWQKIREGFYNRELDTGFLLDLMLLDFLGIPPEAIILKRPLESGASPMESPEAFHRFVHDPATGLGGGPLKFNNTGGSLLSRVPTFLRGIPGWPEGAKREPDEYLPDSEILADYVLADQGSISCDSIAAEFLKAAATEIAVPVPPKRGSTKKPAHEAK